MTKNITLTFFAVIASCCLALLLSIMTSSSDRLKGSRGVMGGALAFLYIFYTGIVFLEVKPWFEEFYRTWGQISWFPPFSSADPVPYLKCSFKPNPTWAYLYSVYGPCAFLRLVGNNYAVIYSMFTLIFCILSYLKVKLDGLKGYYFISVLWLMPWVIIQFTIPNKEIFIIFSMFSFLIYYQTRKNLTLALSIIFAIFSRLEFVFLYSLFLVTRNFSLKVRQFTLASIVFGITFFYKFIPGMADKSQDLYKYQDGARFGFTAFLNHLCEEFYLFVVVIIPRIFLNIFEKTKGYVFSGNQIDGALSFLIDVSSEWIFFFSLILSFRKRKIFNLRDDRSLLFWLFIISVVTVPFPLFRYILPAYVLLVSFILEDYKDGDKIQNT